MEVKSKLLPGENGTKGLLKQDGEQLICVRYRYDEKRRKRYKTVELIVDAKDWIPETCIPATRRVYFKIGYGDILYRVGNRAGADHRSGNKFIVAIYANNIATYTNYKYSTAN